MWQTPVASSHQLGCLGLHKWTWGMHVSANGFQSTCCFYQRDCKLQWNVMGQGMLEHEWPPEHLLFECFDQLSAGMFCLTFRFEVVFVKQLHPSNNHAIAETPHYAPSGQSITQWARGCLVASRAFQKAVHITEQNLALWILMQITTASLQIA